MRRGSMMGDSLLGELLKNISSPGFPWRPDALILDIGDFRGCTGS